MPLEQFFQNIPLFGTHQDDWVIVDSNTISRMRSTTTRIGKKTIYN